MGDRREPKFRRLLIIFLVSTFLGLLEAQNCPIAPCSETQWCDNSVICVDFVQVGGQCSMSGQSLLCVPGLQCQEFGHGAATGECVEHVEDDESDDRQDVDDVDVVDHDDATLCDAGDGLSLDVGDFVTSDDGCQSCTCIDDGSLNCLNATCPLLPRRCPFGEPLQIKHECCPVCPMGAYDVACGCLPDQMPVCGANGKSYLNPCEAECKDVNFSQMLCAMDCPCKQSDGSPVCGVDGRVYENACQALHCANVEVDTENQCGLNDSAADTSETTGRPQVTAAITNSSSAGHRLNIAIILSLLTVATLSAAVYVTIRRKHGLLLLPFRKQQSISPAWRQLGATSEQFIVGGHSDESSDEA